MLPSDTLKKVHNSVCAVGVLPVPLDEWIRRPLDHSLHVRGSGFLIRHNTVITNKHVLDSAIEVAKEFGIPESQLFVSFIAPPQDSNRIGTLRMIRRTLTPEHGNLDIALLEIKAEPEAHFHEIVPLQVATSRLVAVSEEVLLCGYPYGNILLEPDGKPYRFGPVVQQGYVSGLSPLASSQAPEEILLDVRTAGGMSGCPVVRSRTGEVIGIHYEGMIDRTAITMTCFAIPLHNLRASQWLAEFDKVLRNA